MSQLMVQATQTIRNELENLFRSRFYVACDLAHGDNWNSTNVDKLMQLVSDTPMVTIPGAGELWCTSSIEALTKQLTVAAMTALFNEQCIQQHVQDILVKYHPDIVDWMVLATDLPKIVINSFVESYLIPTSLIPQTK